MLKRQNTEIARGVRRAGLQSPAADDRDFSAAPVPQASDLSVVRQASKKCRACPLWKLGTCTVFGEGNESAKICFVGEQPGDAEDRQGRPFVGPAGRVLEKAMVEAGIDRADCYTTNAVKHFKWEPKGERRMHKTPTEREIAACRPWLEAELRILQPSLVVCLGATAVFSVFKKRVKVLENRGRVLKKGERPVLITVHPSMLLRIPNPQARRDSYAQFVSDLRAAKQYVQQVA